MSLVYWVENTLGLSNVVFVVYGKAYTLYTVPKNNLNMFFKKKSDMVVMFLGQTFVYKYQTQGIALHPLQPCQARFLCGDSDYFWDSVYCLVVAVPELCTFHM